MSSALLCPDAHGNSRAAEVLPYCFPNPNLLVVTLAHTVLYHTLNPSCGEGIVNNSCLKYQLFSLSPKSKIKQKDTPSPSIAPTLGPPSRSSGPGLAQAHGSPALPCVIQRPKQQTGIRQKTAGITIAAAPLQADLSSPERQGTEG
jgi:hypothetical protein